MTAWNGASVLITGGTGSFGKAFTRRLLDDPGPSASWSSPATS